MMKSIAMVLMFAVPVFAGSFTEQEVQLLVKYNYAESANQDAQTWEANTYVALNRLNSGRFGDNLTKVVRRMSSAIRNNSKQWRIANNVIKRNSYEQKVYEKIEQTVRDVLSGKIQNNIGNATHFENVEAFGKPYWAKDMVVVATVGKHTYYRKK
jgi:spore germination cell wall hydrolase CwlJ-like protein